MWGKYCHKGKESEEIEIPQEHNAFHKEHSLGRQRLWGIKVVPGSRYDLKNGWRHEGNFHENKSMEGPGWVIREICRGNR